MSTAFPAFVLAGTSFNNSSEQVRHVLSFLRLCCLSSLQDEFFLTILAFFTATSKTFPPNLLQICRNKSIISWCFFITMPWKLPYFGVFLSCQVFSHLLEFCLLFLGFFSYESCSAVFLLVFPSSCWKKRKHFWASEVGKKTNDFFTWWCEKLCSRTWQNVSILQWELMLLQKLLGFTLYNPGFSVSWNDRIFECYF